ncbi:MAG: hypothetical protein WAM60_24725 [Candidatus Promineifilaceae bacterium]
MKVLTSTHKILTAFISLGVFAQMFFAGLWHAEVLDSPDLHIYFGLILLLASLIALIAALAARMGRNIVVPTLILFVLILLQPILIEQRRSGIPLISAFHPLNAAFIGVISGIVATRSRAPQPEAEGESMLSPVGVGD